MFSQIFQSTARRSLIAARWMSSDASVDNGWVSTMADGIQLARQQNKPIMLVIHRHWCSACKELIPLVKSNAEIIKVNKNFITVEMTGSNEKEEEKYAPDGLYVPRLVSISFFFFFFFAKYKVFTTNKCLSRILFMNSNGELMANIRNESNLTGTNTYVYSNPSDLINSMKKALNWIIMISISSFHFSSSFPNCSYILDFRPER